MPFMTVDQKGRATVPEEVRTELGITGGDVLMLRRTGEGTYELRVGAIVPKDDLWFLHPEIQGRIKEAEDDFAAGRFVSVQPDEDVGSALAAAATKGKKK